MYTMKIEDSKVKYTIEAGDLDDAVDAVKEIYNNVGEKNMIYIHSVEVAANSNASTGSVLKEFAKKFNDYPILYVVKGPKSDPAVTLSQMIIKCVTLEAVGFESLKFVYDDDEYEQRLIYGNKAGARLIEKLRTYSFATSLYDILFDNELFEIIANELETRPGIYERLAELLDRQKSLKEAKAF